MSGVLYVHEAAVGAKTGHVLVTEVVSLRRKRRSWSKAKPE